MGLSAPKKRAKLSHDPNNTFWSRSATKYGQRILESQGWVSGDLLGALDAPHAALHTRANTSHIRVAFKDNTLGLGAKYSSAHEDGNTTGLDVYQDLLGRLNGKGEVELESEHITRYNMRRSAFVDQRWGSLRFVSGGLLLGDNLQELAKKRCVTSHSGEKASSDSEEKESETTRDHTLPQDVLKRKKEQEPAKSFEESLDLERPDQSLGEDTSANLNPPSYGTRVAQKLSKTQRRAEKAERKCKRRLRREQKLRAETTASSTAPKLTEAKDSRLLARKDETILLPINSEIDQATTAPVIHKRGRNAVRQRYIQHKKMSMMDSKALNEILMIKG